MTTTLPPKQPKDFNHWIKYLTVVHKVRFNPDPIKVKDTKQIRLTSR